METDQKPEWLKSQLQPTLNMIPAYTWYAAPSGALRFVNERAADYGGLPKDHPLRTGEGAGEEWDLHITFLHPDDRDETRRVWANSLRTGRASEVSFRVRGADGGYRWFLSRAEPVREANGTVLCWIGINLDIEERKQAEFYLAEGQRLAHTGSWALTSAGFEYWSSELFQIHGLDPTSKAHQQKKNIWRWCIRRIENSLRSRSKRYSKSIAHSTSRSGLCVLMDRFVTSGMSACPRPVARCSTGLLEQGST